MLTEIILSGCKDGRSMDILEKLSDCKTRGDFEREIAHITLTQARYNRIFIGFPIEAKTDKGEYLKGSAAIYGYLDRS